MENGGPRKNEFIGMSPIELHSEFLKAYELMPLMKDGPDFTSEVDGEVLVQL